MTTGYGPKAALMVGFVLVVGCGSDRAGNSKIPADGGAGDAGDAGVVDDADAASQHDGSDGGGKLDADFDAGGTPGEPWVDVSPHHRTPGSAHYDAMAYDAGRNQVVLVTGSATWVWVGTQWEAVAAAPGPAGREGHAMAYDAARDQVVLFGGRVSTNDLGDTWLWDGTSWSEATPATSPPATYFQAMAYDEARQQVVMHGGGGYDGDPIYGGTWLWDGTSWTEAAPTNSPGTRSSHVMTYDSARQRVVLYGGTRSGGFLGEVWEWDGSDWTQMPEGDSLPPIRIFTTLVYDPARGASLLIGGERANNLFNDTWAWDGSAWTDLTPQVGTWPERWGHAAAYDASAQQLLLYGGVGPGGNSRGQYDETLALPENGGWTDISPNTQEPGSRLGSVMIYDSVRGVTMLFGGITASGSMRSDTWLWDGSNWTDASTETSPSGRFGAAMAFDEARRVAVLFGGSRGSLLNDTWVWDGSTWTEQSPAAPPPAMAAPHMAYDASRRQLVLHDYGETWTWDGSAWSRVEDQGSSTLYWVGAMAYDPQRSAVVAIVGSLDAQAQRYTTARSWSGSAWLEVTQGTERMSPRDQSVSIWDPRRRSLVVFGGRDSGAAPLGDTWEFAGEIWRELTPATGPGPMQAPAMAYDTARHRGVLVGTDGATWEWNGAVATPVP